MTQTIGVGLLGCGTVGSGVVSVLQKNGDLIRSRSGVSIEVRRILVRHPDRPRRTYIDRDLFFTNPDEVIRSDQVHVVVEAMGCPDGDSTAAYNLIMAAIEAGKPVVTANKQLLAEHGKEISRRAAASGVTVRYEAAVAAAVPIIKVLRESLTANWVLSITGILNGTTNYILERMSEDHLTLDTALSLAQEEGFAEADPTSDLDGRDAAYKLILLARLAFSADLDVHQVKCQGIRHVTRSDLRSARAAGRTIKLLAHACRDANGVTLSVEPVELPLTHPLASVRGVDNGVVLETDVAGQLVLHGKGAGGLPTASAVIADVIETARELLELARIVPDNLHALRQQVSLDR